MANLNLPEFALRENNELDYLMLSTDQIRQVNQFRQECKGQASVGANHSKTGRVWGTSQVASQVEEKGKNIGSRLRLQCKKTYIEAGNK